MEPEATQPALRNWQIALFFLGFWLLALSTQWENGAYQSDLGGHADEPAHVVTGLMLRDYVAGPMWRLESPIAFAKDYYDRFPKVALGHYPPGYYAVEGLWMLPVRELWWNLVLSALLTGVTALLVLLASRPLLGHPLAVATAIGFILYRIVQSYTAIIMADMLLVAFCIAATMAWGRFQKTLKWQWSVGFGLLAAAAILTKGSGLLLALVPAFSVLLTRQFVLLKNWRLWVAPVPVLLFAAPWMFATVGITKEGMTGQSIMEYFMDAVPFYADQTLYVYGIIATILVLLGIVLLIPRGLKAALRIEESIIWAYLFSVYVLFFLVPSGFEDRYLLPGLPPALILSILTFRRFLAGPMEKKGWTRSWQEWAVAILIVGIVLAPKSSAPDKVISGPSNLVDALADDLQERTRILVCADPHGEGAVIAAAVLRAPELISVSRGTKVLSTSDWMGRGYEIHFDSIDSLIDLMREEEIEWLVMDGTTPEKSKMEHQILIERLATEYQGNDLTLVKEVPGRRRSVEAPLSLYRVAPPETL